MPGGHLADADRGRRASPYPGLLVQTVDVYERSRRICEHFPTSFTEEEMLRHVESDIPVLIFSQGLDTQTPVSFGRTTHETLPNAFFLEWPSEGHVIATRSVDGCAGDIAAAFLDDPAIEPNTACAQGPYYRIPFEGAYNMVDKPDD